MKPFLVRESQSPIYMPPPLVMRRARGLSYTQRGLLAASAWFALAGVVAWAWWG